jgi:hypothetical protein
MPTIALDLFYMVSTTSDTMERLSSSFDHTTSLILGMALEAYLT